MEPQKTSRLQRPRRPLPGFIKDALFSRGLMEAYRLRPPYQQNDYIGGITQAVQERPGAGAWIKCSGNWSRAKIHEHGLQPP